MHRLKWFLLVIMTWTPPAWGYAVETHREVSEAAVGHSTLETYSRDVLGLGATTVILGRATKVWVGLGAVGEDDDGRFLNHFHDPLVDWDEAGLVHGITPSSVVWAQHQPGASTVATWRKAREQFHAGLVERALFTRHQRLVEALRTLGHQMHLVQDASVTAHTRGDPHPKELLDPEALETHTDWVRVQRAERFASWVENPVLPDPVLLQRLPQHPNTPVPIAHLIDSTEGPETPTAAKVGTGIGLAEFTNTNFFSADTILTAGLPLPRYESIGAPYLNTAPLPGTHRSRYYRPKISGGVLVDKFVAEGMFGPYFAFLPELHRHSLSVDAGVAEDYAAVLLPRAVGYSAALIDYFLRGDVALVPDARRADRFEIENRSAEEMEGELRVYFDDVDGNRFEVGSTSTPRRHLGPGERVSVSLTWPTQLPPKVLGEFTVVFKGRLGLEGKADGGPDFAVAAGRSTVPPPQVAPGVSAGSSHGISPGEPHTHMGAWAYDPNDDLASYQWSWASCPVECPPLSGTSGSLSGGLGRVPVPGPTFTIPTGGDWGLSLEVRDAAGNRSQSTVIHDYPEYFVRAVAGNSGESKLYGEPFAWAWFQDTRAWIGEGFSFRFDVVPDGDEAHVLPAYFRVACEWNTDPCVSSFEDNLVALGGDAAPWKGVPFPAERLFGAEAEMTFTTAGVHRIMIEWRLETAAGIPAGSRITYVPIQVG